MARRSARKSAGLGPPRRERSQAVDLAPGHRRRPVALAVVAAAVVVGAVAGALPATRGGSQQGAGGTGIRWSSVRHLQTSPPPWPSQSALLPQRLAPAGLHALSMEGTALHIHEHLDVYVDGHHVTVPALVGIDQQAGFLTELHTHDSSGIVHVESPVPKSFTLGQFFCEWGVKLNGSCLGPYRGKLAWWVDGVRRQGNPAQLVLQPHQEIVIAAGTPPTTVPTSYGFPPGL